MEFAGRRWSHQHHGMDGLSFPEFTKITATLAEYLNELVSPSFDILSRAQLGHCYFHFKKNTVLQMRYCCHKKFCDDYFFDPLSLPGLRPGERMIHNGISDSSFFSYTDELLSGNREKLYDEYGFHIRPATDDKPYFSQFLRWKSLPQLSAIFGSQNVSFLELGWLISAISFLQIASLAVLLILVPLFKLGVAAEVIKAGHFFISAGWVPGICFLKLY